MNRMKFRIEAVPPFDFDLSCQIFSQGDPQFRSYQDERFRQALRLGNKLALLSVGSLGSVSKPNLSVELASNQKLARSDLKAAKALVSYLFTLDLDLKPFYRATKADPVMSALIRKLYGLKAPATATVFEALIDSIIEQQISLKAAHSMEIKMIKSFGDRLHLEGETYYAYPTPQKLSKAGMAEFRKCGLSSRKAEYIREISGSVSRGELDLEKFKSYPDTRRIIEELDRIRGVGAWTAELTAIRGMRRREVIAADDLGIRRSISHYYRNGRPVSSQQARRIAKPWGNFKGMAAFYLIMAEHLEVKI